VFVHGRVPPRDPESTACVGGGKRGGLTRESPTVVWEADAQPIVGESWCGGGGRLSPSQPIASGRKTSDALLGGVSSVCALEDSSQRRGTKPWCRGRGNMGGGEEGVTRVENRCEGR